MKEDIIWTLCLALIVGFCIGLVVAKLFIIGEL